MPAHAFLNKTATGYQNELLMSFSKMIKKHGKRYILEIQNREREEGLLCAESFDVVVEDNGGERFLVIKCRNLEPDDEYDEHTVTLSYCDIDSLCQELKSIIEGKT